MKKLFVLSLALVMVLAMATTCFAAAVELTEGEGSATGDIVVTYSGGADADRTPVYSVDVAFNDLAFDYAATGYGGWLPSEHKYEVNTGAGWTSTNDTITVTNHSNAAITASFAADFGEADLTATFSGTGVEDDVLTLASCVGAEALVGEAVVGSVKVELSSTAPSNAIADTYTITVTIAPVA